MTDQVGHTSSHTPGPWSVDDDDRPRMEWNRHIYGPNGLAICFMAHSNGRNPKRDAANARLIAAAPALLEALQAIVKSLSDQDEEGLIEHAEQMVAARAAIARATGAQS